jgi:glycolate oxidase FAD binding subunit
LPLRPASSADLAARISALASGDTARESPQVRITGAAGSGVSLKFDAARPVVDISTLRMNKVLEQSPKDMTVTVQAGITLEALQRHLAWQDQWLPVDPPAAAGRLPGQRTIGGLIATNSLGPLRIGGGEGGGGDWRLLVLGMKWVDAHGTLMASGCRTMKNVAGYPLHRMLIGSAGTLGVIAEVTLRTFVRPPDERCIILFCERPAQAEALVAAVLLSATTPACIQIVGAKTFAANPLGLPSPAAATSSSPNDGGMAVVIGFLGRPESCDAQVDRVRTLPEARGLESIAQTAAQAGRLRLWMTTQPAFEGAVSLRIHRRSSQVADAVAALECVGDLWVVSEAATGILRVVAPASSVEAVRRWSTTTGARISMMPGRATTPDNGLAARLKHALDPHARFGRTWE